MYGRGVHLPYLDRCQDAGIRRVVEQEDPGVPVDRPGRVDPRSDGRSPALCEAFYDRVIDLHTTRFCNHVFSIDSRTRTELDDSDKTKRLTRILIDSFSPSSTGTKLP